MRYIIYHKTNKHIFLCFIFSLFIKTADSQINIHFSSEGNYWEHTDLIGFQTGFGLDYRFSRVGLRLSYNIGYGTYNRLKDLEPARFDDPNVFVNHYQGSGYLLDPEIKSDYARQRQIDVSVFYKLVRYSDRLSFNLQAGMFFSRIQHYYIIDMVRIPYFEHLGSNYELDLYLISDQQFFTRGIRLEFNAEYMRGKTIFSPYIAAGFGPNHTDFATVGIRILGPLRK